MAWTENPVNEGRYSWRRLAILLAILLAFQSSVRGQTILSDELQVPKDLQPLDRLLREQLETWFHERDLAAAAHGAESVELYEAIDRHNPLTVHGATILQYAREHPGTLESLACLSYLVDQGEGEPAPLFRSACAELIVSHKDNPALSWLCSECTRPLSLENNEDFLERLLKVSQSPTVQGAAAISLARLYDYALEARRDLPILRKRWERAGLLKARPSINQSFEFLEKRSPSDLAARRDEFLKLIIAKYPNERAWSADRTDGRLDYKFREDPKQPTYQELANRHSYEINNLRIGCVAPDFKGNDLDGREFSLAKNRGKTILLMFSFKGCGPCEGMYPALRRVQERYGPSGFSILGVMADETVDSVRQAVDARDITWRCVWDGSSGPIGKIYHVQSYPTVILIGPDGRIVSTRLRHEDELVASIERGLKEQSGK